MVLVFAVGLACGKSSAPEEPPAPAPVEAAPVAKGRVELVDAPEGDVPTLVTQARASAESRHRKLLVYIGATWCEPCQRFHHAAEKGELDAEFPDLTLLVFDMDRDGVRLGMAGYQPEFIPYFGIPDAQGKATDEAVMGSIKGAGAVGEIVPHLHQLLGE